jgi:hypothetical protein
MPHGMSVITLAIYMIDSTIGVMESSTYQELVCASTKGTLDSVVQECCVFIAIPMDPANLRLEDVHEAVKEACNLCGLIAERIDEA